MIPSAVILGASLCAASAGAHSRVEWSKEGPRLVIDGKTLPATIGVNIYYLPDPRMSGRSGVPSYRDPEWTARMKSVIDRGAAGKARLILFNVWWADLDHRSQSRPEPIDRDLDFAPMDSVMDHAARKGVYLMPITVMSPGLPEWWLKENRFPPFDKEEKCDACETDSYGNTYNNPSMGSDAVRRDYGAYLEAVIRRYRSHPALAGWSFGVGATGEDNYGPNYIYFVRVGDAEPRKREPMMYTDYSPFFQREFRAWMKRKYKTDAAAGVPRPEEMIRERGGPQMLLFPDPSDLWWGASPDVLTQKGRYFYEFRNAQRAAERRYYAALFKKNDPDHLLLFGGNAEILDEPLIDGITVNPNLNFEARVGKQTEDFYHNVLTRIVEPAVRRRKLVIVSAENISDGRLHRETGKWETDGQLAYIEAFGKAVKCSRALFAYTVDLMAEDAEIRWLPTWFSAETLQAARRIAEYVPAAGCACAIAKSLYQGQSCGEKSLDAGCGQVNQAYHSACKVPEEQSHKTRRRESAPEGRGRKGCGDGVCDDFEQEHPEMCPRDCRRDP
ncbi:MAG: beta-galactosidase [Elusimicrobiota bacterium]